MVTVVREPFQTYQVIAGKATPLVYGNPSDPQQGLIINNDLTDVMTVGFDMGVTVGRTDVMTVQPLQAIAYDGTMDLFGIMPAGQVASITIAPGMTYWAPSPAQAAAQINALGLAKETTQLVVSGNTGATKTSVDAVPGGIFNTGVPLYTKSSLVKNQTAVSQAPGTTNTSAVFPISQVGYEIFLTVFAAGNFLSFYHLTMQWLDSGTGIITAQEDYWFIPGTGAGASAHTIIGAGPTKGDQLQIVSSVPAGSSVNVSHAYVVLQNSRLYADDFWETLQFVAAGVTGTAEDTTAGQVAASSFNVNAGLVANRVLPFYNGIVTLWGNTTSNTSDMDLQIVNLGDTSLAPGGASAIIFEQKSNANGFLYAEQVALPAGQCEVQVTNGNAAAKTLAFSITAAKRR